MQHVVFFVTGLYGHEGILPAGYILHDCKCFSVFLCVCILRKSPNCGMGSNFHIVATPTFCCCPAHFRRRIQLALKVTNWALPGWQTVVFSTAKCLYSPGSRHDCQVKSQSHLLRVDKLQKHIRGAKALKDARMKAVAYKLLRIHAAFIS